MDATFAGLLCEICRKEIGFSPDPNDPEALESLPESTEYTLRAMAAAAFCRSYGTAYTSLLQSPQMRHYRSTTKRRGHYCEEGFSLRLRHKTCSALDSQQHQEIYDWLTEKLNASGMAVLAKEVNFAILRGMGEHPALILNVRRLSGDIVRKMKQLVPGLKEHGVSAFFSYLDEKGSDYYLERERDLKKVSFKKFFGPAKLALKTPQMKLLYPLTGFSQINEPMLPLFCETVKNALALTPATRVIDLYCGYGLFGLHALADARELYGADCGEESIACAAASAAKLFPGKKALFQSLDITRESLLSFLPPPGKDEVVILDPPRSGCHPGVIETIVSRRPRAIAAIYCGPETMQKELSCFVHNHYVVEKLTLLDLFPGTLCVESMALLTRKER